MAAHLPRSFDEMPPQSAFSALLGIEIVTCTPEEVVCQMRVTEAMPVYRSRIQGKPAPIVPTWDLTGGGLMPPPVARLTLALSSRPPLKPFIGPVLPPDWVAPTSASAPDVQGPAADSETASTGETGG